VFAKNPQSRYCRAMPDTFDPVLVICSFPDSLSARQIGMALVEKQLAACVTFLPGCTSIFCWQEKITESGETLALIKSTQALFSELEATIREHHPYEIPEIIGMPLAHLSHPYRQWMERQLARD
jgi:periplasmic divalent cation tolerance protein